MVSIARHHVFLRAVAAFLALPGVVAFAVPAYLASGGSAPVGWRQVGFGPILAGGLGLLACVREFYVAGQGTLAPWSPPRHLVVSGLYRYSRNPMYIAVVLILAGWSILFDASTLWPYTISVAIAFHLRVVLAEEPWLARGFGDAWNRYESMVPRWLGFPKSR